MVGVLKLRHLKVVSLENFSELTLPLQILKTSLGSFKTLSQINKLEFVSQFCLVKIDCMGLLYFLNKKLNLSLWNMTIVVCKLLR